MCLVIVYCVSYCFASFINCLHSVFGIHIGEYVQLTYQTRKRHIKTVNEKKGFFCLFFKQIYHADTESCAYRPRKQFEFIFISSFVLFIIIINERRKPKITRIDYFRHLLFVY